MALTAQEVLDKYGFIPVHSQEPIEGGVDVHVAYGLILEPGTVVVVVGELSEQEVLPIYEDSGWDMPRWPNSFHYKAVAE